MENKYIATAHISNNMGCGIKVIDYNEETVTVDLVCGDITEEHTVKFYPNVEGDYSFRIGAWVFSMNEFILCR